MSLPHLDGVILDFRGKPQPTTAPTASAFVSREGDFTPALETNNLVLAYTDAPIRLTPTVTIAIRADGVDW